MEEKYIIVKFHKGINYKIPAAFIATQIANFYAELDGYDIDSQEWLDTFNRAIDDEFELFEWIHTRIKWRDLRDMAERIETEEFNPDEDWENGNHTISANW